MWPYACDFGKKLEFDKKQFMPYGSIQEDWWIKIAQKWWNKVREDFLGWIAVISKIELSKEDLEEEDTKIDDLMEKADIETL